MAAGLEDRLDGVHIGDLLCLQNETGDSVAGFVTKYSNTNVVLSHEDPKNTDHYASRLFPRWTKGNRKYLLAWFSQYHVIPLPPVEKK